MWLRAKYSIGVDGATDTNVALTIVQDARCCELRSLGADGSVQQGLRGQSCWDSDPPTGLDPTALAGQLSGESNYEFGWLGQTEEARGGESRASAPDTGAAGGPG